MSKAQAKKVIPPQVNAAVFAFPGLNYAVHGEAATMEKPAYETGVFMWDAQGQRHEVHCDSVDMMTEQGWTVVPPPKKE